MYAVAVAAATFSVAILDFRLQEAVVRYSALFSSHSATLSAFLKLSILLDFLSRAVATALVMLLSSYLSTWLAGDSAFAPVFIAAALAIFAAKLLNAVAVGVLRATDQIEWHAKALLLAWTTKLAIVAATIEYWGPNVIGVIVVAGIADGVANLFMILRAGSTLSRMGINCTKGKLIELRPARREITTFLTGSAAISASDSFVRELDTIIIALFLSLPAVGLYRMAKYITQFAWRAVDPVYVVLQPVFAKLVVENRTKEATAIATKIVLRSLSICAVGWILAMLTFHKLINFLLGEQYSGSVDAVLFMLFGVVLGAPFIWAHAYWIAAGKPHVQLAANAVSAIGSALCFFALTPALGLTGAAVSFAVALALPFLLSAAFFYSNVSRGSATRA